MVVSLTLMSIRAFIRLRPAQRRQWRNEGVLAQYHVELEAQCDRQSLGAHKGFARILTAKMRVIP